MEKDKKEVKLPPVRHPGAQAKYPFGTMKVGQTVSIEDDEEFDRARRAAKQYTYRHPKLHKIFASRKGYLEDEDGNIRPSDHGGTIWRME
jgi:hypothetical protein